MCVFLNYTEAKAENQYDIGIDVPGIVIEHEPDFTSMEILPEILPDQAELQPEEVETQNTKSKSIHFDLAIDSEFKVYSNKTSDPISVQGVFSYKKKSLKLMVINSK
jgi:hypothetical protein